MDFVLVIAKLSATAFEGRLRTGTGPGSDRVASVPVLHGTSKEDVITKAYFHTPAFTVVEREDPVLTGC